MATFGSILKKLRNSKGLTGEDLGKKLNVTKMAISRYETDKRFPDKDTLVKLADYFDVTVDYLLGRTDDPNVKVYKTEVDGEEYTIGVNKNYPHDLSPENIKELITKLETVGFDVNKLIEQIKSKDDK